MKFFLKKMLWAIEQSLVAIFYRRRIEQLKGLHQGKRCFVIGNGPSLNASDLDLIRGEYSFAANSIFKIFSTTQWRPTYYMVQDALYAKGIIKQVPEVKVQHRFISLNVMLKNFYYSSHDIGFYLDRSDVENLPQFSGDFSIKSFEGYTVLYSAIQLAIYMGFKEIYLLGVDHRYSAHKDSKGNTVKSERVSSNHFFENQGKQVIGPLPNLEYSGKAYEAANKVSGAYGVKIVNCTRGGELEAFQRIPLEDVLAREA